MRLISSTFFICYLVPKIKNMKKIYYKHIIVRTGEQDDVEKEINSYIDENINIISLNVTPEKVSDTDCKEGYLLQVPKYWYHISLVYTSNEE